MIYTCRIRFDTAVPANVDRHSRVNIFVLTNQSQAYVV